MSERGYFQLRWAVPGFSFILIVFGLNCLSLLQIVSPSEGFGIALALLSIFTASAIGFLTTQAYWWNYNRGGEFVGLGEFSTIKSVLAEYGFSLPREKNARKGRKMGKEEKRAMASVLDFAVYSGAGKDLLNYVWRRWDIFHLLRTTCVALLAGVVVGIVMRIYFEGYLFKVQLWSLEKVIERIPQVYLRTDNAEGVASALMLLAVFLICLVIWKTSGSHMENYYPTWKAIVRRCMNACEVQIREAFPENFNVVFCKNCTKRISNEFNLCPYCGEKRENQS